MVVQFEAQKAYERFTYNQQARVKNKFSRHLHWTNHLSKHQPSSRASAYWPPIQGL